MYRYTTPIHKFKCDIDPSEWDAFRITYKQGARKVIEVTEEDAVEIIPEEQGYILSYRLTQEETRKFAPNEMSNVQIRAHYSDGRVIASKIFEFDALDVLSHEILGG